MCGGKLPGESKSLTVYIVQDETRRMCHCVLTNSSIAVHGRCWGFCTEFNATILEVKAAAATCPAGDK